jgi:hypothetical protein
MDGDMAPCSVVELVAARSCGDAQGARAARWTGQRVLPCLLSNGVSLHEALAQAEIFPNGGMITRDGLMMPGH